MTTSISPQAEQQAELEERKRQAWAGYTESLRGLEGAEYDAAEERSWEQLQRELDEVREQQRALGQHADTSFG